MPSPDHQLVEQTVALRDRVIDLAAELSRLTEQLRVALLNGAVAHDRQH